ncbi:MAG: SMC-Scp complex subunit ScpB [Bacillota bacterium]|nr:SMC-Scp complex subunit ScpB [Bacillota bacterium]
MNPSEARAILEALIFAAVEPLPVEKAARILGLDEATVRRLAEQIKADCQAPDRGLTLEEVAGGLQLVTKPQYAPYLAQLGRADRPTALTPAALETLAIIAYRQPVSKAEIEEIRGVRVEGVLHNLEERGFIVEVGRKDAPGRPILYGTTELFLKAFGLRSLADLPPLEEEEFRLVEPQS